MSRTRTLALLLAALVLAVVAFATGTGTGPAAPAAAAAVPGACSDAHGVTVVVDFTNVAKSQGIEAGCAHDPADGIAALTAAGFAVVTVQQFPAAVCRIDAQPATACVRMPPASAYWSYWYSTNHRTWTYAGQGAGYRTPPPGTVDGWSFSTGSSPKAPAIAPPATPPATTTTITVATTAPAAVAPTATSGVPRGSAAPVVPGSAPPPSATAADADPASSTTAPSASRGAPHGPTVTPSTGSASVGPEVRARSSVKLADAPNGSGSPWGVIGGAAGAGALALAGGAIALRRRRQAARADDDVDWE